MEIPLYIKSKYSARARVIWVRSIRSVSVRDSTLLVPTERIAGPVYSAYFQSWMALYIVCD